MHGFTVSTCYVYFNLHNKERYLQATCGVTETQPARLELFPNAKLAAKGSSRLQEILFHSVNNISIDEDGFVNLNLVNGSEFSFYVTLSDEHKEWIQYCYLLLTIPYCYVPEEPNYRPVPQNFIDKFQDPTEFHAGRFCNVLLCVYFPTFVRVHLGHLYHL